MSGSISKRFIRSASGAVAAVAGLLAASPALADEGGTSVYLLGSGGPGAAILPPVEGIYFQNDAYYYDASASAEREFVVGGHVVAGLDAEVLADFATLIWVPTTDFAGGTLLIGAVLPLGAPAIDVSAIVTGPLGGQVSLTRHDRAAVIGDPLVTAQFGWTGGKTHVTASTIVNIPVGHYREDQLANLAFHRWAADFSLAGTWHDDQSGWDLSTKAGVTFNGTNGYTDYDSGNDFHLEAAVEKVFSPAWSAGIQGYYFKQISGDSGPGARLGPFKGEVAALGGTIAHNFIAGKTPASLRLKILQEFGAKNRLEGTSVLLTLSTPLWINMPAGAE